MHPAIAVVAGYILGSIPFAYLAGKLTRGIDLRQHGSGNLGATNVYRTLGGKIAAVVLVLDALKGAVPVLMVRRFAEGDHLALWAVAAGIAAIAGHAKPIFLLWRGGGKGVATAAGVFLALAPVPTLAALATWLVVVLLSGYVSLASLAAAIALPIAIAALVGPSSFLFGVSVVIALFVFWTHRANIGRLRRGEEHRFGRKASA
ncbi:MAG: glycerol-3-phosphate 1-O-acyltransferase PlsY [Gemmatimonadaceae bacterium]|nr:glycerol-3-phosphate 1-O-acyltransferase PlsY [Gemmatimonadaceae bacterium]NUQ94033.1 glycerol-3-phosphate 1-O-acyltransferase PlsY [Gemmatimonadaceae bacterium]NUR19922.1 glycerol-3-phosphate 1-O-acyltransferase PlsY [Gemmatimonadaceae bacterium]NUS98538.1 glycerol-3-phosphate 1-O-acyltransferase PlsY [Gemmatimonadaceae bacterium]